MIVGLSQSEAQRFLEAADGDVQRAANMILDERERSRYEVGEFLHEYFVNKHVFLIIESSFDISRHATLLKKYKPSCIASHK